jgi:hypothetical protein
MASLDSLPPDQRAVLQLVLQRGRSYDDIAQLLSIDRAGVRQRALAAFDAMGPQTRVDPARRALLTDYILGQLPPRVAEEVRDRLASSASERAWARVLASELGPIANGGLPEIPTEDTSAVQDQVLAAPAEPEPARRSRPGDRSPGPKSSRVGGAILLGVGGAIAVLVVVVILLVSGGGSKNPNKNASTAATTTPASATSATSTTARSTPTTTTPTQVVAQINLNSPGGGKSPTGIAQVLKQGTSTGIIIVASGVTANTKHDAYAVWLMKPGGQGRILGFVNPGVGNNGRLQTAGALPTDAAQYTQLLVTREIQASPKGPGTIILQGNLKLS